MLHDPEDYFSTHEYKLSSGGQRGVTVAMLGSKLISNMVLPIFQIEIFCSFYLLPPSYLITQSQLIKEFYFNLKKTGLLYIFVESFCQVVVKLTVLKHLMYKKTQLLSV